MVTAIAILDANCKCVNFNSSKATSFLTEVITFHLSLLGFFKVPCLPCEIPFHKVIDSGHRILRLFRPE